jgi:hypothetical protein
MRVVGASVRAGRKSLGISRAELARRTKLDGLDEQAIATIEAQPSVECDDELADGLARALEVSRAQIVEEENHSVVMAPSGDRASGRSESRVSTADADASDTAGPLDRALSAAFDPNDHTAQDRFSVEAALRYIPFGFVPPREVNAVARAWLDAASVLRQHGVVATFTALVCCVSALDGFAAEHARRLRDKAKEAGALDGEASDGRPS